ncbi:hypothetical protein HELRODRAFT_165219 [Helobdella robusta]|uniref:Uncharacterized protein n=1 Tax=Helobdella robusta TaxID=6412 RepID=T1EWG3_HELRO|nr:hypothetical protein HELRODRAFT_165219 [Helobdella robusta]ESN93062.1 hypothetical protein HELRODRAFT_165219 [Helobdella robusta]
MTRAYLPSYTRSNYDTRYLYTTLLYPLYGPQVVVLSNETQRLDKPSPRLGGWKCCHNNHKNNNNNNNENNNHNNNNNRNNNNYQNYNNHHNNHNNHNINNNHNNNNNSLKYDYIAL